MGTSIRYCNKCHKRSDLKSWGIPADLIEDACKCTEEELEEFNRAMVEEFRKEVDGTNAKERAVELEKKVEYFEGKLKLIKELLDKGFDEKNVEYCLQSINKAHQVVATAVSEIE